MFNRHQYLSAKDPQPLLRGVLLAVFLCQSVSAEPENNDILDPTVEEVIDGAHKNASELLNGFASQLDNYFAEETIAEAINDTSATIRFDMADPSNGDFYADGKLKLRLVLPRSQRRIRLLLDVDDEDIDNTRSTPTQPLENEEDRRLSLALRFIRKAREGASLNLDIGARRHDKKIQGFARVRASLQNKNEQGWSTKIHNDLRQYYSSGYWNRLSFDAWRNTRQGSTTVFRTSTSLKWERTDPGVHVDQTVGVYKQLNKGALLAFEALASYNTSPEEAENYYEGHQLRVRYRRNAFRPWLHFELWPNVSWLTEDNRDPKLGILFRTEVRFGNKRM